MQGSFCLILASKISRPQDGLRLTSSSNSASEVALVVLTLFPFPFVGFLPIVLSFSLVSKRVYPQFSTCESFVIAWEISEFPKDGICDLFGSLLCLLSLLSC